MSDKIKDYLIRAHNIGDFPEAFQDAFAKTSPMQRKIILNKLQTKYRGNGNAYLGKFKGKAVFGKESRLPKNIDEYINNFVERFNKV